MFRTLMLVVCVVSAELWDSDDTTDNPKGWLEDLRRRLMTDNYDYQPSSDEMALRAVDKTPEAQDTTTRPTSLDAQNKLNREMQFIYDSAERNDDEKLTFDLTTIRNPYMTHADVDLAPSVPRNSIEEQDVEHGISRNDLQLQVYLSDSKRQVLEPTPVAEKNVSYKVIQPSLLSRRMGGAAPRFVEEVGANGVSLLSLDGAPFPEFQLPSARRQYQSVKDSFSEDWLD